MTAATYLDSSAIVELAVEEPESAALRTYLRRKNPLVSSALVRIDLIRINDRVLNAAGALLPPELRSFDAIHIASAQLLAGDLGQLVTYDDRMPATARDLAITTASPT